jgi:hypothetical protein
MWRPNSNVEFKKTPQVILYRILRDGEVCLMFCLLVAQTSVYKNTVN